MHSAITRAPLSVIGSEGNLIDTAIALVRAFSSNGSCTGLNEYREVQRLCMEQGIEDFVFHDLRHCAATNLADAGVEAETIMSISGHRSMEMYLRYRTVKPERLDAAMARLDAAVNTVITPGSVLNV